ncbi:MAG: hypothetical protein AAF216_12275 [Pseudomonadota bacterium]
MATDLIFGAAMGSLISLFLLDNPVSAEPPRAAPEPVVEQSGQAAEPVAVEPALIETVRAETPALPSLPEPEPLPTLPVATPQPEPAIDAPPAPTASAWASPDDYVIPEANARCIAMMAGFPDDSLASRYQFFRLIQEMSRGMTPEVRMALAAYSSGTVSIEAPVMETIEDITNPVLRQAAPAVTVAQMDHLIGFGTDCATYIDGQVTGLAAADPSLNEPAFNLAIGQDALFLRQILLDSLYRLGADVDPQHGAVVANYQRGLVRLRDDMEFAAFDAELAELEALALGDLGDRLDTANASINDGMYDDSTGSAVRLAKDMSDAARRESQQRMARILIDILAGG